MNERLTHAREQLQAEATRLAGGLRDAGQRAEVYRHLFRFSGGNHVFPLIAAHGALWARGYLAKARVLAQAISWQYALQPAVRRKQLERLDEFENVLRDINRTVCIDTYVNLHFTARYGADDAAAEIMAPSLLEAMARVHAARRAGRRLPDEEKRAVFEAHFRNEQEHVVGPRVAAAVAAFEWPLVRALALRPPIRFAYFSGPQCLRFRNFADRDERIANGLKAFEIAATAGWQHVEGSLARYGVLPAAAFLRPDERISELRAAALGT